MSDSVENRPKQSREYKSKALAQVVAGLLATFGLSASPEEIFALLAGIEAGYIEIRISYLRRVMFWALSKVGIRKKTNESE